MCSHHPVKWLDQADGGLDGTQISYGTSRALDHEASETVQPGRTMLHPA